MSAVMETYGRCDLDFTHGEGAWLITADNRRYLDFASGIAVNSLGHCHPLMVEAIHDQASKVWHTSNLYHIKGQEELAAKLCAKTPFADRVFFANSGVEALEGSIKLARRYQHHKGEINRYRTITINGAFHGRSLATISAAANPKHLDGFGPVVDGFDSIPFGDIQLVKNAVSVETAAILLEPIQGEGGIRVFDETYLRAIRELCDQHGLILIFDEVQCGMGRTGKLWAHEWAGASPDILASAKGLGGGFPIGAFMTCEKIAEALPPGSHGTTFGGNPLAMAVANTVVDIIADDDFLNHVQQIGDYLKEQLNNRHNQWGHVITEIRGHGLMLGLKCNDEKGVTNLLLCEALRDCGLLSVPGGDNVLRILPPLIIDKSHVDQAIQMIDQTINAIL